MFSKRATKILFLVVLVFFFLPHFVWADTIGQSTDFFIDPAYDLKKRTQITAVLEKISERAYFYIEKEWWNPLEKTQQSEVKTHLDLLAGQFDNTIYPTLTEKLGPEWKPGIDKDTHITILIHQMREDAGGYFNSGNEYPKAQVPNSNEREMLYFNAGHIANPLAKALLAHEFVHLITFNQKDRLREVTEEVWLNEGRAEYAPTLLGYDVPYQGSNLQARVRQFLTNPEDSLTEWLGQGADYGILNVFVQYLVEHYGIEILIDSLKSEKVGIPSLNYALGKNGFKKDFSQIFTDWTIAIFVNDCQVSENYCFANENLKQIKISPSINFLPFTSEVSLKIKNKIENWSAHWYKFVGGKGTLKVEFDGEDGVRFMVPYLACDSQGCSIGFLEIDEEQKGQILISGFGEEFTSLAIIPSLQEKAVGFDGSELSFEYSWKASLVKETKEEEKELIEKLLAQIEELKKEIATVQAKIDAILAKRSSTISCQRFDKNLYYGMRNDNDVKCLQEFLKSQGPDIYPESLVTGFFGPLTQAAVIRFQEKYAGDILVPYSSLCAGEAETFSCTGTGFVGQTTRTKINQLLVTW